MKSVDNSKQCISCKGELEEGIVLNQGLGWTTKKMKINKFLKRIAPKLHNIRSFRCKNCGLIHKYTVE